MIAELEIAKNPARAQKLAEKESMMFLSGGTEINRLGSPVKGRKFVSLKDCGLGDIGKVEADICGSAHQCVSVGSTCTFTNLLYCDIVPDGLKEALRHCFSMQKRNMATIGGNIAAARDDSYLIPTLAALNAHVVTEKGKAPEFVLDYCCRNHKADLLTAVLIPDCARMVASYRCANTASSHAAVTVSVGFCMHDGNVRNPIVAAAVKGVGLMRLKRAEEEILKNGVSDPDKLREAASACQMKIADDLLYGSAAYRRYLVGAAVQMAAEKIQSKMKKEAAV